MREFLPYLAEEIVTVKYAYADQHCEPANRAALPDDGARSAIIPTLNRTTALGIGQYTNVASTHHADRYGSSGYRSLSSRQAPRLPILGQCDPAVLLQLAKRVADRCKRKLCLMLLLDCLPDVARPAGLVG